MSNNPHGTVLDAKSSQELHVLIETFLLDNGCEDADFICVVCEADGTGSLNIDMVSGVPLEQALLLMRAIVESSEAAQVVDVEQSH